MQYPVNFAYDATSIAPDHGITRYGFASSEAEAVAIAQKSEGPDWRVTRAELVTEEFGTVYDFAATETAWADEIQAGWVQILRNRSDRGTLVATHWRTTVVPAE